MTTVVRAVGADEVEAFYGFELPSEIAARGGYLDGALVAVWGLSWVEGKCWIFWNMRADAWRFRVTIWREAHRLLASAREAGEAAVFSASEDNPIATRLHQRLGFDWIGMKDGKRIWKWS